MRLTYKVGQKVKQPSEIDDDSVVLHDGNWHQWKRVKSFYQDGKHFIQVHDNPDLIRD